MIKVPIEHTGLPVLTESVNVIREIDGKKSWNKIKKIIVGSVGHHLRALLSFYTYSLILIDTHGREYPLDGFTCKRKLLNTKGPNSEIKTLKVIWSRKSNTRPTESIAKHDTSTRTDIQFQTTDPDTALVDEFFDEYLKDDVVSPSEDIEGNKEEYDQYLYFRNNESKIDQTGISEDASIKNLLELFKDSSSTSSPVQQNNSMPMSSSSEQHLNPTEGQDNDPVSNQSQFSSKRPNQSEGDTTAKKRKKGTNEPDQSCCSLPTEIMKTYIIENKIQYDSSSVPMISIFAKDKMIQFKENIDQTERSRYFSESKKVPRIQGKKQRKSENNDKSKDPKLPVIILPLAYQRHIADDNNSVLLAFACVKEHRKVKINGKRVTEFCLVGYQKFKYYSDEDVEMSPMSVIYPNEEDMKAGQLIFQITPVSDGKNEYTLIAHSFKVNDKSEKEIGPVMFRLSPEYIEAAREDGFEFGQDGPAHRYAAYLFKFNKQSKRYEPDFETLVLSDYMFYDSNKKKTKKNEQNDALQN